MSAPAGILCRLTGCVGMRLHGQDVCFLCSLLARWCNEPQGIIWAAIPRIPMPINIKNVEIYISCFSRPPWCMRRFFTAGPKRVHIFPGPASTELTAFFHSGFKFSSRYGAGAVRLMLILTLFSFVSSDLGRSTVRIRPLNLASTSSVFTPLGR